MTGEGMAQSKGRIAIIDIMVGLAITFVVIAHHLFPFMPRWYVLLYCDIYNFHMPLFIFLSAFLIRYSYKGVSNLKEYGRYIWRKIVKFGPPYLLIGVVCAILFNNDGFSISKIFHNILILLIEPLASETTFLWYLYYLVILYAISPLVFRLSRRMQLLLFVVFVGLYFVYPFVPRYFCIDYLCRYLQYYMLGVLAAQYGRKALDIPIWLLTLAFLGFMSLEIYLYGGYNNVAEDIVAYLSIPACLLLAKCIMHLGWLLRSFEFIGRHCFDIYILHLFFIQAMAYCVKLTGDVLPTGFAVVYLIGSTLLSITLSLATARVLRCFKLMS